MGGAAHDADAGEVGGATHAFPAGAQVSRSARRVFGPVASRRYGRSLGVDLLPHKTCSLDCIYCECGRTNDLRTEEGEFCPTGEVCAELDAALVRVGELDCVTFSGSGEPLLHEGIGRVVSHLKERHPDKRVVVLTNGTRLSDPKVRSRLRLADLVVPSLDSATHGGFARICRPHPTVRVADVVDGLEAFRREFAGELQLEIFVVPGVNDSKEELDALRAALDRIRPDLVQLNRLDRPGTVVGIPRPTDADLERIARRGPLRRGSPNRRRRGS
jgi:wyosine [tRNA(Phe)-imidazoG37] synthetase (radical SAM superfamily)